MGILARSPGGPEVLEWTALETGEPGRGEALIAQRAVGVNFIDTYFRSGLYPWPSTPLIPGSEAAGVVERVGADVSGLAVGDRVAYTMPVGAYRQRRVVPADRLVKIPDAVPFEIAASLMLKGLTAQFLVNSCFPVKAGPHRARARGRRRRRPHPRPVAEGARRNRDRHGRLGGEGAGSRPRTATRTS